MSAACVPSPMDVLPRKISVSLQCRVHMRLGMEHHPVLKVTPLLAIFKQHQRRYTQSWNRVLQHHVHWQPKHLPVKKPSEDISHHCQCEDEEEVFRLKTEDRAPLLKIAIHRRHSQCHRPPPPPMCPPQPPVPRKTRQAVTILRATNTRRPPRNVASIPPQHGSA